MPKVTVLMPAYNAQLFLRKSIESVLKQTWSDFEFLIINDGSTDNSREIILSFKDHRIRLVDHSANMGLTKSLNHGLQLARGEYIARQDADDISYPMRLERQIQFLDANPDVVLLGTRARAVDQKGIPRKEEILRIPLGRIAIHWFLMFQNAFVHSSVMFRHDIVWKRLGGYDESFDRAQDYEMWSRTARSFNVENLADVLLDHRFEYGSVVSQLPLRVPAEEDIVLRNLQTFLKQTNIPGDWPIFINHLRRKDRFDQETDWRQVSQMLDRIYVRYCQLNPKAEHDPSIRSHLADRLYWLAYYAAPHNRLSSLQAYTNARKFGYRNVRHPSIIKYITLWCMGEWIRNAYTRLKYSMKRKAKQ